MIIHGDDERKRNATMRAAALAHIRLKNLRPLMYAGQGPVLRVIMRLGVWLGDGYGAFRLNARFAV